MPFDNAFNPTKAKSFSFLHHKPREDNRTVLMFHTTRRFFAEVVTNERSFQQPGSLVGRSLQCRTKALASYSLGSRTGIRSLRVRADGIERVAIFDPMSSTAGVDAREADDKDGVKITGRYGCGTSTACTPATMCLASVLTAIRFCFGQWIFGAVVQLNPLR